MLIFIGDCVLFIFSLILNFLKAVFKIVLLPKKIFSKRIDIFGNNVPFSRNHKVIETEIFNSSTQNQPAEIIKPDEAAASNESSKIGIPKISLPKLHAPKLSVSNLPEIKVPELKLKRISIPVISFPKLLPVLELKKTNLPKKKVLKTKKRKIKNSKPNFPTLKFPALNFSFPKFSFPKLSLPKIPEINISVPKITFPKFHAPKINIQPVPIVQIPTFSIPKLKVKLHKHKKRGRKRLSNFVPFGVKFKYLFIGFAFSFIFIFLPTSAYIFISNLPNPEELSRQDVAQTTKIYDKNGNLLYQIYANQNRTVVHLSQIPKNLQNATIAIEDKNFYTSPGVDALAIARSAYADLTGKPLQGGSTITQQLIKARLLSPERSIDRKIKEIVLAIWADKIYSKDQILEMYFNQVPYGGTSWGVEAAAQTYFGKDVKDLDLAQSAFLAGLPQAPSVYSPYSDNVSAWKPRQNDVLRRMRELGYITKKQEEDAKKEQLAFEPQQHILKAPHFVMYVKDLLIEKYGLAMVERGGLSVTTTLDSKIQDMAQKTVADEVNKSSYLNFTNAGALITNPKNGDVLAMVGGKDYYDPKSGNYNVTTALRQPGSTIKAITYTAALMNGYTAATQIPDTPVSFATPGSTPYSPVNYDGRFHGNVSLRTALGNSINIPAVKVLNQIGVPTMVDLAKKMGITTWGDASNYGLALTLGAAEVKMTDMAVAYGTLANQGERVDLNPLQKVVNSDGQVLEEKKDIKSTQVLPREIAFIVSNILADNNARSLEFGLNSPLVIPGHTVSVKTGTTDNKRDNWTIGYTPNLLTAVWVGNNDNAPMNPILASGITGAAPIWNKIMGNMLDKNNIKNEIYATPDNIVAKPCNGKSEYFVRGTDTPVLCRPISVNGQKPNP